MNKSAKLVLGTLLLLSSMISNAEKLIAVEWAPFVKAINVTDEQLLEAADRVNLMFLAKQPGFIKRELIKKNDGEYADVIHWETKEDAESAGEMVFNCNECLGYFKMMDEELSTSAGAGFSHYSILKTWNKK